MPSLLLIIVTGLILICASFVSGLTGFGNAIIFQTLWAILGQSGLEGAGDLKEGVAIVFLCSLTIGILLGRHSLRTGEVKWDIVTGLVPGSLIFNFVGTAALATLNQAALKKGLGMLFLIFACWQLYLKCKTVWSAKKAQHWEWLMEYDQRIQQKTKTTTNPMTPLITSIEVQPTHDTVPNEPVATFLKPVSSITLSVPHEGECEWPATATPSTVATIAPSLQDYSPMPSHIAGATVESQLSVHSTSTYAPTPLTVASIELIEVAPEPSTLPPSPVLSPAANLPLSDCGINPLAIASPSSTTSLSPSLWWSYLKDLSHQRQFQAALGVGAVAGFLGGCFGTNGPPIMAFFSMITITKGEIRGTFAWTSMILIVPELISLLVFNIFNSNDWLIYILLPPFTLFGTWLGNLAHHAVDVNVVMMILQFLVLLSTVALCGAFDGSPFALMMLVIYMAIIILIVGFIILVSSATYRFLRVHPECTAIYLEEEMEKKLIDEEKARAARLGQSYESHPELRNSDGTRTGYTSWHG